MLSLLKLLTGIGVILVFAFVVFRLAADPRSAADRSKSGLAIQDTVQLGGFAVGTSSRLAIDLKDITVHLVGDASADRVTISAEITGTDADWAQKYFESLDLQVEVADGVINVREGSNSKIPDYWKSGARTRATLEIRGPEGLDATIETVDGEIALDGALGTLALTTQDGHVRLDRVTGGDITVTTSDGPVQGERITADRLHVTTSDGEVDLGLGGGALTATTQGGDVTVRLDGPSSGVDIESDDGDVTLVAGSGLAAEIAFEGRRVRLADGFSLAGESSDGRAVGRLNGGGPAIRVSSSEGAIRLDHSPG